MIRSFYLVMLLALSLFFADFACAGTQKEQDEIKDFHSMCLQDADVVVNGYQFKSAGLSFESLVETIKTAFAGKSAAAKSGSDDALYLIHTAYSLEPSLQDDVIRKAAYQLCMREKMSTDR